VFVVRLACLALAIAWLTLRLSEAFAAPSRDETGCRTVIVARRSFRTGFGVTERTRARRAVRAGWSAFLNENSPM
jgi:hypothetical protein